MPELLRAMMKEEWRTHSTMFGSLMFALFPVLVAGFTFAFSFFMPFLGIPLATAYQLLHYTFLLFGVSVGGLALFGREAMNRRFGQVSMIAYSSRTLPVSERRIMLNLAVNDIIFYSVLYILPFLAAFYGASVFTHIAISAMLPATLFLSFLAGLSILFFLSTLYVHAGKLAVSLVVLAGSTGLFAVALLSGAGLENAFPPLLFFQSRAASQLALSLALVLIPGGIALSFPQTEFPESVKRAPNRFDGLSIFFSRFFREPWLVAKDMLDLHRSEGGMGKIVFSFVLPLILVWAMLKVFSGLFFMQDGAMFLAFCAMVGALSSSIYNWLTQFDTFSSYSFLPVSASVVIRAKMKGFILLNISSLTIVLAAAVLSGTTAFLPAGLVSYFVISIYSVSVTVYLTGLEPNSMLYNGKVFLLYISALAPVMVGGLLLGMIDSLLLLLLLPFIPVALLLLGKGFRKWDGVEVRNF